MNFYDFLDLTIRTPILVYGAGRYAKLVYNLLNILGLSQLVDSFVVQSKTDNPDYLFGVRVITIGEAQKLGTGFPVIIAIKKDVDNAIAKKLIQIGFSSCISFSEKEANAISDFIFAKYANCPIANNRIFVDCYEGMGYKDNPKYLIEFLHHQNPELEIVWHLEDSSDATLPPYIVTRKKYTESYYSDLYSSKFILSNDGIDEWYIKRKGQFVINTWHGTGPFKKVFASVSSVNEEQKKQFYENYNRYDLFISNSFDNTKMFRDSFLYEGEIMESGSPRIDFLFNPGRKREEIRQNLGIGTDEFFVLYAPTFRNDNNTKESFSKYIVNTIIIQKCFEERFGKTVKFGYRFHHSLYKFLDDNIVLQDGIDLTYYVDVMELILASDALLTDYSSIMWDFSLTRKPVFLYHADVDEYTSSDRGFYMPPERWPYPIGHTEEELARKILEFDDDKYQHDLDRFFEEDPSYDNGHACERLADRIIKEMHGEAYRNE